MPRLRRLCERVGFSAGAGRADPQVVFDPERDDDSDARRFYLRLFVAMVITAVSCAALWPSVTGFVSGPDHGTTCLAIVDGWHADKGPPSAAEMAAASAALPPIPTRAQAQDPAFMDRWRVAWRAAQSAPAILRANAQIDWLSGSGACVRPSRHRLIVSGVGLGAIGLVLGLVAIVRHTRPSLRHAPAEVAAA